MPEPDRIQDYLRRLTPLSRNNLLTELERLEVCDAALPGSAIVVEKLRAEFRKDGRPSIAWTIPRAIFLRRWNRYSSTALPSMPIPAGYCAARWLQSGNGSAEICCRRWRATMSTR
jgi:hypothetical protein